MCQNKIDTSYTINGTFKKEIKKYPFIKIAKTEVSNIIIIDTNLNYKTLNGRALKMDFYHIVQKTIQPAVILIHGGGWKSGNKVQMQELATAFAREGYACFCVEYRLSNEAKYPAAIIDIKNAIEYLKNNSKTFNIIPTKIALLGCSSGGQLASLIATNDENIIKSNSINEQNSSVQAVINLDGILAFHQIESQEGKAAADWLGGTFDEVSENWITASALTHCNQNSSPTLFINSSNPRFHAGQDDMILKFQEFNIYFEVKSFPNSPHSFWFFKPWFDQIVNFSTKFLDKVFKNNYIK